MKRPRDYKLLQQGVNRVAIETYIGGTCSTGRFKQIILTSAGPVYPTARSCRAMAKRLNEMADWLERHKI